MNKIYLSEEEEEAIFFRTMSLMASTSDASGTFWIIVHGTFCGPKHFVSKAASTAKS